MSISLQKHKYPSHLGTRTKTEKMYAAFNLYVFLSDASTLMFSGIVFKNSYVSQCHVYYHPNHILAGYTVKVIVMLTLMSK